MDRADHLGQPVISVVSEPDADEVAALRHALWPDTSIVDHRQDLARTLAQPQRYVGFIARHGDGAAFGFAEASLRHDYVNGTKSSPVAFLEGIYVDPAFRRTGVARQLIEAVENWARQQGCSELASDTGTANIPSQKLHDALGFTETQRVVFFRKILR